MDDEQPNHLYAAYYKGYKDGMKQASKESTHITRYNKDTGNYIYSRYYCGNCGEQRQRVCEGQNYCPACGKRLNWNDVRRRKWSDIY